MYVPPFWLDPQNVFVTSRQQKARLKFCCHTVTAGSMQHSPSVLLEFIFVFPQKTMNIQYAICCTQALCEYTEESEKLLPGRHVWYQPRVLWVFPYFKCSARSSHSHGQKFSSTHKDHVYHGSLYLQWFLQLSCLWMSGTQTTLSQKHSWSLKMCFLVVFGWLLTILISFLSAAGDSLCFLPDRGGDTTVPCTY